MKNLLIVTLMLALAGGAVAADKPAAKINDPAVAQIDAFIAKSSIDKTKAGWKTSLPKPEVATFDAKSTYLMHVTTNKGPLTIEFMPQVAPMHVTNFIYLARLGFFDGLTFHRVIPGFMAQGGDPLGTGTGGPGYQFEGEFNKEAKHEHAGILSMANAGPGTDGSQFFLTFKETPWLDGKHTVFGYVVDGIETLDKLEAAGSQSGKTSEKLMMDKVTIEVKK